MHKSVSMFVWFAVRYSFVFLLSIPIYCSSALALDDFLKATVGSDVTGLGMKRLAQKISQKTEGEAYGLRDIGIDEMYIA